MKMKKLLVVFLVLMVMLCSVSCGETNDGEETKESESVSETVADTEAIMAYTYEIKEEIIVVHETEDGRRSTKVLRYPQISGMGDASIVENVNSIFREVAEKQFKHTVPDVDIFIIEDTVFNYEVSEVEVTLLTSSFVSVKNTVYSMSSNSAYPVCPVYTVNIDLSKGEIIEEDDIISDFNLISSAFLAGDFTMTSGAEDLLDNTNYEDMILQYKSDYASYPELYFTKDSLGMSIDLVAALGSNACFEISIDDISDALQINPTK